MLLQRIFTVAGLLPLFLAALFLLPNLYWSIALGGLMAVAAWEWARLAGYELPGRVFFTLLLAAATVSISLWEHSETHPLLIHAPAGHAMYALSAAFWMGIAPAWLYYRWEIRARLLRSSVRGKRGLAYGVQRLR